MRNRPSLSVMALNFNADPDNASPLIVIVTVTPATPLLANMTRPVIEPRFSCAGTAVRVSRSAIGRVKRMKRFIF